MPSTEAKTHFGALLDMAQRNPVTIEKKGRPVAVMISESEYAAYQQLKLQALQNDLSSGIRQADEGQLVDSETAFNGLMDFKLLINPVVRIPSWISLTTNDPPAAINRSSASE